MKKHHWKPFYALPPYMGGKRKLVSWIFGHLAELVPRESWSDLVFADAFVGGGAVSLYAKAMGFKAILANDWSERSQIVMEGLLQNQRIKLTRDDVLLLTQTNTEPGLVVERYGSVVFSKRHAQAIEDVQQNLALMKCPTKRALGQLLLWHTLTDFVCMSNTVGTSNRPYAEALDGIRDWQTLNPKRFVDGSFPKLLHPTWKKLERHRLTINQGVFGGSPVLSSQQDAIEFVSQIQADIVYLDPPYPGTTGYESTNRILDDILMGRDIEEKSKGSSPFSKGIDALEDLLSHAQHIPVWVLSYGNHVLGLEELIALVQCQAPTRQVLGWSQQFVHMPHVAKRKNNQELLVIAIENGGN